MFIQDSGLWEIFRIKHNFFRGGVMPEKEKSVVVALREKIKNLNIAKVLESGGSRRNKKNLPRVIWVTNQAAPYRLPVWESLGERVQLEVKILEDNARFSRNRANRGAEWAAKSGLNFSVSQIRTMRISWGGNWHYLALGRIFSFFPRPSGIVVGGWDSPAYWQALVKAKLRGIRVIGFYESTITSHGFTSGIIPKIRAFFFRRLDGVVVPGVASRDAVLQMGVDREYVTLGFNPVDVKRFFALAREARKISQSVNEMQTGHRFVFVGRMIKLKNPGLLIAAFDTIRRDGDTLTLVGTGDLQESLANEIKRRNLDGLVIQNGQIPYEQMPSFLSGYNTLILPSKKDVWGLVVNEALAAGLHVVVTKVCGVVGSVSGMPGVYVSEEDEEDISRQMCNSRKDWTGPIELPEILIHTPEAFAENFYRALMTEKLNS